MKKNFFKKLSFVLALAMIVTALAPAAGVFAKAAPKLNATSKYLYLDVADKNEYDFNVANKQTGWKYLWSSANEDVADVNAKNGVTTATGVGKTTISVVITDKAGEEVDELTATVVVRDNIKDLVITNKPANDKLAVGVENNFNRSFTTVSGSTKKTSGVTRWSVDKTEGATINATNGVFVATAAGTYTITARAFQSTAKYTSWLADNTKYASYVTATATYTVTVAPSMTKIEQVDLDTFKVTFDSAVTDAATKLAAVYLVGTTKISAPIKTVTMDSTNKVATVDMYLKFNEASTYVVSYPNMADVQFVAATSEVKDVTGIAIVTTTAQQSIKKTLDIALYNANKVNIADTDLLSRVDVSSSSNLATVNGKDLYMYTIGQTTTLTATFHTYNWVDGKEAGNLVATGTVTCVEQATNNYGIVNAYTIAKSTDGNGNFVSVKHTIAKNDTGLKLFVQLKGTDTDGNVLYTNNTTTTSTWKFTSSNSNVIIVDASGNIWPVNEGAATVVVTLNDKQVGACEINVTAARKAAVVTLGTNSATLSNGTLNASGDVKNVSVAVKDQLAADYDTASYSVAVTANGSSYPGSLIGTVTDTNIQITPVGVTAGTYNYTVTITDSANSNATISTYLTITVKAPVTSQTTPSYYKVEADSTSYDMKVTSTDMTEVVTLSLYGYDANGVKMTKENINGTITVKDGDGAVVTTTPSGSDATIQLINSTASGSSMTLLSTKAIGTWVVTATSGSTPINATNFEVKNTQGVPTLTVNKVGTTKTDLLQAINDCFGFTLNGETKTVALISDVEYTGNVSANSVRVDNVYIYELLTGTTFVKHKVKINTVITFAQ